MTTVLLWVVLAALLVPGLLAVPAMRASGAGGRVHATGLEVEVGYRPELPALVALLGFVAAGLLGTVALATSGPGAVGAGAAALLAVVVLLAAVGTLRRRPRVLLTAHGLDYRGWAQDASVAWSDVEGTAIDARYAWRPLAEVLVAPGATSLRHRVDRFALPEPAGPRSSIRMLGHGLQDPRRLLAFVEQLAALPPAERSSWLGERGLAFLVGAAGPDDVRGTGPAGR